MPRMEFTFDTRINAEWLLNSTEEARHGTPYAYSGAQNYTYIIFYLLCGGDTTVCL